MRLVHALHSSMTCMQGTVAAVRTCQCVLAGEIRDIKGGNRFFGGVQDQMKAGFLISDCVDVEVRGPARAYHSRMPFTQGTVTAISNDAHQGYYWEVQVSVFRAKAASPVFTCRCCTDSASHLSSENPLMESAHSGES